MKYKSNIINVLCMCTAYCKCQPCGLTSAGRGHIKKTNTGIKHALPIANANLVDLHQQAGDTKCRIKSGNCEGRPNHWSTVFTHWGAKVTHRDAISNCWGAIHIFSLCFECIWCNKFFLCT